MIVPIEVPSSTAELLNNPQRVKDAFALLNLIATAQVVIVPVVSGGRQTIIISGQNAVIPIPLGLSNAILDPIATATSCQTAIITLFNMLRATGQLPTSAQQS